MTTLFDERERAAEYGFTHGEELRFLATRQGVVSLAAWAANRMELHDEAAYTRTVLDAFLGGQDEAALLERIRGDLVQAGHAEAAKDAGVVLARATAEAATKLHGAPDTAGPMPAAADGAGAQPHHPHGFWGWEVDGK